MLLTADLPVPTVDLAALALANPVGLRQLYAKVTEHIWASLAATNGECRPHPVICSIARFLANCSAEEAKTLSSPPLQASRKPSRGRAATGAAFSPCGRSFPPVPFPLLPNLPMLNE
ncbi:unnamed protein product [Urochloa humidicola]